MNLKGYQKEVDEWIREIGVRYFDIKTNTMLLSEEVGEFSGLVARVYGEQSFKGQPPSDVEEMLGDELADIYFVLTCMANQLGFDLEELVSKNMKKKTVRDFDRHRGNEKLAD